MSIIQKQFILHIMKEEGARLKRNQGLALKKKLHFRTGEIFSGRDITVSADGAMSANLKFRHKNYQRFLDIKRKVKTNDGKIKNRNYAIHNRYIWGHMNNIVDRAATEFTNTMVQFLRKNLNKT